MSAAVQDGSAVDLDVRTNRLYAAICRAFRKVPDADAGLRGKTLGDYAYETGEVRVRPVPPMPQSLWDEYGRGDRHFDIQIRPDTRNGKSYEQEVLDTLWGGMVRGSMYLAPVASMKGEKGHSLIGRDLTDLDTKAREFVRGWYRFAAEVPTGFPRELLIRNNVAVRRVHRATLGNIEAGYVGSDTDAYWEEAECLAVVYAERAGYVRSGLSTLNCDVSVR